MPVLKDKKAFEQFLIKRNAGEIRFSANTTAKVEVLDEDETETKAAVNEDEKPASDTEGEVEKKADTDTEDEAEDEKPKPAFMKKAAERFITLRIVLDSFSPINEANGFKFKEKINTNAFDQEVEIAKQVLYCYVDHAIGIEKMIGSTINKSMVVSKEDNVIIARVKVDEDQPLSRKVADLIQSKVLTSNSFIFHSEGAEYNWMDENDVNREVDLEIVFTKGKLISIDPVYQGFYPQAKITVETKADEVSETVKTIAADLPIYRYKEAPVLVSPEQNEINNVVKERSEKMAQDTINLKKLDSTEFNEANYQVVRDKWNKKEHLTAGENKTLYAGLNGMNHDQERSINLTIGKNGAQDFVNDYNIRSSMDGTSQANGLALIEILQTPWILKQWVESFPELSEATQTMPIVGLNEVKQSILIPDKNPVTSILEGAASTSLSNKTTNTMFYPTRYSVEINQNHQLNDYATVFAAQTENVKDNIRIALRTKFYANMLVNVGKILDLDNYTGGATKEAVVETDAVGTLTFSDMDRVMKDITAKYGDEAKSAYVISMHQDTLTHLEKEYFASQNNNWKEIYNVIDRTFRGVKIIIANVYPEKEVKAGANIMTFWTKKSVVAYGCAMVTEDNPYKLMSEDQASRYIRTRGEIKMCDPNLTTKVLQVRSVAPSAKEIKAEAKAENKANKDPSILTKAVENIKAKATGTNKE